MDRTSLLLDTRRWLFPPPQVPQTRSFSLCFVIGVYREHRQLDWCLDHLRRAYPRARVLCVLDGDEESAYRAVADRHSVELRPGSRLKLPGTGHTYLHRLIREFLETDDGYMVKIDPDSWIRRPFAYMLERDLFGTILGPLGSTRHIQGGCQVLRRSACEALSSSGALEDPRYRSPSSWCGTTRLRWLLERQERLTGIACCDHILMDAVTRLGLEVADWTESYCLWRTEPSDRHARYAITHPHKLRTIEAKNVAPAGVISADVREMDLPSSIPSPVAGREAESREASATRARDHAKGAPT